MKQRPVEKRIPTISSASVSYMCRQVAIKQNNFLARLLIFGPSLSDPELFSSVSMASVSFIRSSFEGEKTQAEDRIPTEEMAEKMAQRDAFVITFSRAACGRIEGLNKNTVCIWRDPHAEIQELILDHNIQTYPINQHDMM